ncbi:MAG: hypothetical protein IKR61_01020, partial [Lachnospiraceae bacterium]|nr:hypothetical protein [Lachnospiraceae bacterium]
MRTMNLKNRMLRLNAALLAGLLFWMPPAGMSVYAAQTDHITEKTAADEASDEEKTELKEYPAQPEFVIGSAKDWEIFAENAHSDQWSRNRTVRLTADIQLSGETPRIVFFSGTFDGGGHTIDGVSIRAEVSETGLFEQLVEGAEIRDLKVSGAVHPVGRQTVLGGLVGVNRGTIRGCTWFGSAEAHQSVGGIAGRNESGGIIENCRSG